MSEFGPDESDVLGSLWINQPRSVEDGWAKRRYMDLGLRQNPSLEEIRPHAVESFQKRELPGGIGLVLGRLVTSREVTQNPLFNAVATGALEDPEAAVTALMMLLHITPERLARPQPD